METQILIRAAKYGEAQGSPGEIQVRHFNKRERLLRSFKFLAIFLVLAVVSVLIPALHFVLVPLFTLFAPLSALFVFIQKDEIASAKAICPYCQKQSVLPRAKTTFPFRDSCQNCLQLIEVTKQ